MAKILDKLLPTPAEEAIRLGRLLAWYRTELDSLSVAYSERKKNVLARETEKLNKKLLPLAFLAGDKAVYANRELEDKLQKYDVKKYLSHRGVNHKAATAVFAAIRAGEDYTDALALARAENELLLTERDQYIAKLDGERTVFLQKHPVTDTAPYESALAEMNARLADLDAKLSAENAAKEAAERARILNKGTSLSVS